MPQFVHSLFFIILMMPLSFAAFTAPLLPLLWPTESGKPVLQPEPVTLRIYTEHSPPGEYLDVHGEVAGATVNLIRLLLQRLDLPATIELLPWARALALTRTQPNSALFETVRNPEREGRFKWVGPLKIHTVALYGRSDVFKGSQGNFISNSKHLACEYRDSVHVNHLKRLGFSEGRNLILTVNHGDCFNLLLHGRVQLVVLNEASFTERQLQMQQSGHQLVMLQLFSEVRLYLAFSADTDDSRIARWQQVLEHSYLDGSMRRFYQGIYTEQMINRLEAFAQASAAGQSLSPQSASDG